MGWADADHADVGWKLFDDQAFGVDSHRHDSRAGGGERHPHRRITGIFNRDDGSVRRDEGSGKQVERLLRPRCDEDIVGLAHDRAREGDVSEDGFAQGEIPWFPCAL